MRPLGIPLGMGDKGAHRAAPPLIGGLSAILALSGCGAGEGDIARAAREGDAFTLREVMGEGAREGYVFCQYINAEDGVERGFEEKDFPSMERNHQGWESGTGIGVLVTEEADAPRVEWFDPAEVDACPSPEDSLRRLAPDQEITVREVEREGN
ncbi:hypothetical protein [Corynebacterium oculi]|uniref:Lipoprotein n=1 Tax=Corynebacterium oculi TaxID=1544416 RepID=A0A0Q1DVF6_9CORY|nr:hypothetical protein [Corynebacterium oculi]KQB84166.1 hypothetical protein Cocul_00963 [Corynebacterium oculi]